MSEIAYLWHEPHRIDGGKLKAAIGDVPHTPLDIAVARALRDLGAIDLTRLARHDEPERKRSMIVDFQHHFTPRELMPKDLGRRKLLSYDEHGAPSFIMHWMLFDLDEHIRMMDEAGIDVAFLTSAAGMCADLEKSRLVQRERQEGGARLSRPLHRLRARQSARRRRGACASSTAASTSSAFPAW